jgi:nucleoside-diphosphate-sugar epimerase
MNIAVMGGSSHIAKNLIVRFAALPECRLTLFCRDTAPVAEFVRRHVPGGDVETVCGYGDFMTRPFDAIVNCVGAGTPGNPGFSPRNWFDTLQRFDDLALDYLKRSGGRTTLIGFSSGAVYGSRTPGPFSGGSTVELPVNSPATGDFYTISRLYAEAKHRMHRDLRIVDLRVFSFYSCFIDVGAGYFMSDVLKALLDGAELTTSPADMVRDYISPDDLFDAVRFCIGLEDANRAFDLRSRAPAGKFEILESFGARFGLRWRFAAAAASPNGERSVYCSDDSALEKAGLPPRLAALDTLIAETEKRLSYGG